MIGGLVEEFGRLDMAVNNAALSNEICTLVQSSTDKYREMLNTNVLGVYFCMKYEIAEMLKQGSGSIVNLASIAGLNGIAWAGTYGSTKHAVVGLTKSSALDHATQGIRINGVGAWCNQNRHHRRPTGGWRSELQRSEHLGHASDESARQTEEVANAICWLLSDEASFVTGHVLNVDGGFQAK